MKKQKHVFYYIFEIWKKVLNQKKIIHRTKFHSNLDEKEFFFEAK
jgi:hypothetical protein